MVVYCCLLHANLLKVCEDQNYNSNFVRIIYSSFLTPKSVFDYDMEKKELVLRKEKVIHNYDRTRYHSERVFAQGLDGTKIPISLVYKKPESGDFDKNGKHPCAIESYGSYGECEFPEFSHSLLSLLDRGFIYGM